VTRPRAHVVIDPIAGALRCTHCGANTPIPCPSRITAFVALTKTFEARHRECKPDVPSCTPPATPAQPKE